MKHVTPTQTLRARMRKFFFPWWASADEAPQLVSKFSSNPKVMRQSVQQRVAKSYRIEFDTYIGLDEHAPSPMRTLALLRAEETLLTDQGLA